MSDIVERLKLIAHANCFGPWTDERLLTVKSCRDAAAEITTLRATLANATETADNEFKAKLALRDMLTAEITALRARVAELEGAKDDAWADGYQEGATESAGAYSDLWRMLLRYLKKHGVEPASDDGDERHSAHQMMDAVHEHIHNVRGETALALLTKGGKHD
jgi:hypothetical protein